MGKRRNKAPAQHADPVKRTRDAELRALITAQYAERRPDQQRSVPAKPGKFRSTVRWRG
jgi:hypothetical protein